METKKQTLKEVKVKQQGFQTLILDSDGTLVAMMNSFNLQYNEYAEIFVKTASQQQTIERLRETLQNVTSSLIAHIGRERAKEWLEVQQAEELLNTTEPIDPK